MSYRNLLSAVVFFVTTSAWSAEPFEKQKVMAVTRGNNQFATELYIRIGAGESTNLFFSPYSISSALAMTYAGAEGQTKSQMADVLHFPKSDAELHSAFKSLRGILETTDGKSGFQLRVANRLWGQAGFKFLPEFLQVTKTNYGAEMGLLDFKQSEVARQTINSWVADQTEKKIQDLIPPKILDEDTRLVLTNAIYFNARWQDEFNKNSTADVEFHVSSTSSAKVPTMNLTHRFPYFQSADVQIVELPYRRGSGVSMLILLPTKTDGLTALEKQLTGENLKKWSTSLETKNVNVRLPKFKMTSQFSLKSELTAMEMSLPFSDRADFSKMSTQERLQISAVIHKAFVDVNEEGTEAAAATAVAIRELTALLDPKGPIEFKADHPFVFLIRHVESNCILFMGRVANPKS